MRVVDEGPFERHTLPHPTRKAAHHVIGTIRQAGALECTIGRHIGITGAVERCKECEILLCRQLRVEIEVVAEHADGAT